MRLACFGALGAAVFSAASVAQPAASAPAAGAAYEERYAAQCAVCHGADGRSQMALTPSLAGQPSFYAITQLFLFRAGRRDNAAMTAVAKDFSDNDLRGYSDLIGRLPPSPTATAAADAQRVARGREVAQSHQCAGCHGADYAGGKQVPRLAGQREDYLAKALHEFRAGKRLGYTSAMGEALAGLSAGELDDLAHYLSHVPATDPK